MKISEWLQSGEGKRHTDNLNFVEETFQIQPEEEPFDFELAEHLASLHTGIAEVYDIKDDQKMMDLHLETARLLRDATERLKRL